MDLSRGVRRESGAPFFLALATREPVYLKGGFREGRLPPPNFAKVFALADACGVLADPWLATLRMKRYLSVACGIDG